jgi:hypothetical protein
MPLSTLQKKMYFSYIMVASFIGVGNWSTRRKPLNNVYKGKKAIC